MKILMPWRNGLNFTHGGGYTYRDDRILARICVGGSDVDYYGWISGPSFMNGELFVYNWREINGIWNDNSKKLTAASEAEAKMLVDAELTKLGYKLLEDGDKLLCLV